MLKKPKKEINSVYEANYTIFLPTFPLLFLQMHAGHLLKHTGLAIHVALYTRVRYL